MQSEQVAKFIAEQAKELVKVEVEKVRLEQGARQTLFVPPPYSVPHSMMMPNAAVNPLLLEDKDRQIYVLSSRLVELENKLKLKDHELGEFQKRAAVELALSKHHYDSILQSKIREVKQFKEALEEIIGSFGEIKSKFKPANAQQRTTPGQKNPGQQPPKPQGKMRQQVTFTEAPKSPEFT